MWPAKSSPHRSTTLSDHPLTVLSTPPEGSMSGTLRQHVRTGEDQSDVSNVVFPPLMAALDTYVDASSDIRVAQTVEKVEKGVVKKKGVKKAAKKKAAPQNLVQLEVDQHHGRHPESAQPHSLDTLREQYHLRRYSSSEREDYAFGSISLDSGIKGHIIESSPRVVHVSSPPLTDRRPAGSKSNFPPRSPARVLVQTPTNGAFAYGGAAISSPTESHSPVSHAGKTDLGFTKAVESLAAVKLHNYAMKRRDHATQKLKLLKEIRSFDRENNAELVESQRARRDEVLAAWKLRYYVEYLRLQTLKHVVDVVEAKNQDLEEECGLLQQSSAVAEIENEALTKEIARLRDELSGVEAARAALQDELQETRSALGVTGQRLHNTEADVVQTSELIALTKRALQREQERSQALESELNITRQTCQDLVRSCAKKETQMQDMTAELEELRALHLAEQAEISLAREAHLQELEHARMREEDNEIRYRKANDLHAVLNERERNIRHLEASVASLQAEVAVLEGSAATAQETVQREQDSVRSLEQEKAGLQKLMSELARRLIQADEEAIKHGVVERQHRADAKTAQSIISGHVATIAELEEQAAAAQSEIEFLVEENHELAREIECHHMYGEEMVTRYQHTHAAAERNLEYSRFLEEELFCARKLYEKSSNEFMEGSKVVGGSGGVTDMFGDMSEESYGYRQRMYGGGAEEGGAGGGVGEQTGSRPRSFIETWTGLEPVAPMVVHLNSFSKGARRSSRSRFAEFDRPNSATMYNPDSRPNSSAPNNSLVAEQRLLMVLAQLEDKMKSVDRAADSLRFLAEKADAIERVQETTASILTAHSTAASLARQPMRLSEQQQMASARVEEEKNAHIDNHINMERAFADMHVSLDRVNAQLVAQEEEVNQLQARRAECKELMSSMKKLIKKSRKASTKDPTAAFLTEAQEGETETEMMRLSDEMEALKERINTHKAANLELNSQSIALQTELYHLDQSLERSAADFVQIYGEQITAYYPADLAHLIEGGGGGGMGDTFGHGRVSLPSQTRQLNTLYEEDEWSESVANGGEGSLVSLGGGSMDSPGAGGFSPFDVATPGAPGDGGSSLEESDVEAPFSGDSPSHSKSKKHRKASKMDSSGAEKTRKASKMDSGGGEEKEKTRKASKMEKLARKVSKMQKLAKKARKASSLEAESTAETGSAEGSTYDTGAALLEEGSSELRSTGSKAGSVDHLAPNDNERAVVFASGTSYPFLSGSIQSSTAANSAAGLGSPQHSYMRAPPSGSPHARVGTTDTHLDRAARQQIQQARERLAQLRNRLENVTANLDSTLDEVDVIESHRAEFRAEIVRWVDHFHALCGYFPEISDKLRSTTLKQSLDNFAAAQAHLEDVHSRAVMLYQEAHALRASLIHEQHLQAPTVPVEQVAEQTYMLYPISEFHGLVVEDALRVLGTDEPDPLAALPDGSVTAGTEMEGMSIAATVGDGSVVVGGAPGEGEGEGEGEVDPELMRQMVKALAVFGGDEAAQGTVDSAADQATTASYLTAGGEDADEVLSNAAVDASVREGQWTATTTSGVHDEATFQDRSDTAAASVGQSTEREDGPDACGQQAGTPPNSDTLLQVPVTPFTTEVAALAEGDGGSITTWSDVSQQMAKSIKLSALFASEDETPESLLAESRKLRRDLRVWTNDYQRLYGHKPSPADFDSFDEIIKAKIFRKNHVTVLLEAAVKEGRISADALDRGASSNAPATAVTYRTDVGAQQSMSALAGKLTAPGSAYSVPATPYSMELGAVRPDLHSLPAEYGAEFQQSQQWAGMFADSAEETTAALVAEHDRLKRDLREFARGFEAEHGHPPSPKFLSEFPADIQEKIFRKGQLKQILSERGTEGLSTRDSFFVGSSRESGGSRRVRSPSGRAAGSDTESSVGGGGPRTKTPKGARRPASGPRSRLDQARGRDSDHSDSDLRSFPTTPFADRYGDLDSTAELSASSATAAASFSTKLSKSTKYASLYPDPSTEPTEALLAEQRQVKARLRRWAVEYVARHGRKPEPDEYDDFEEDIKQLIFRKNQLKIYFAGQSADAPPRTGSGRGGRGEAKGGGNDAAGAVVPERGSPKAGQKKRREDGSPQERGSQGHRRGEASAERVANVEPASMPSEALAAGEHATEQPGSQIPQDQTDSVPGHEPVGEVEAPSAGEVELSPSKGRSKGKRSRKDTPPASSDAEADRASTAMSVASTYSVPTTPFAPALRSEADDSANLGDFSADMSMRNPAQHPDGKGARLRPPSDTPSVDQMQAELRKLKRDLRRWNAAFVQEHGRSATAEDFDSFDEEVKQMLMRKTELKEALELLGRTEMGGAVDASEAGHSKAGASEVPVEVGGGDQARTVTVDEVVQSAARELADVKQQMKLWQRAFVSRTGREPQRQDLDAEVLALGERRDALKQLLLDHNRGDLTSSRSAKRSPQRSAPGPEGGAEMAPSAPPALRAEVVAPQFEEPAAVGVALAGPQAAALAAAAAYERQAAAVAEERVLSPKTPKRVSFVSRDSATPALMVSAALESVSPSPAVVTASQTPTMGEAELSPLDGEAEAEGVALNPALEQMGPAELNAEYSRVKKALKQRQKEFMAQHGREPGDEDFDSLDDAFKDLVVRKYEIKALLGEELAGTSVKSGKKSKKSKSHKHSAAASREESFD